MKKQTHIRLGAFALTACLTGGAQAGVLMLHGQGVPGDRELYFANVTSIADRTPVDDILGATTTFEIEVIGIYEASAEPDWAVMKLQFECPAAAPPQWPASRSGKPAAPAVPTPARWRMGERSYRFTRDADQQPIAPTGWQPLSDPQTTQAGLIACNEIQVKSTLHAAAGTMGVDNVRLRAGLASLGIGEFMWVMDTPLLPKLQDLAWNGLWKAQRPGGARERQMSGAELARSRKELERIGQEMEALEAQAQAFSKPHLEADRFEQEFLAKVAQVRGGRQPTQLESSMLTVWLGKPESLVVTRLGGAARISEAGGLRMLDYSDQADTRSATVSAASGRVLEQRGAYMSCNVTYLMAQDSRSAWRVADIRIRSEGPAGDMCRSLLDTPE